MILLLHNRYRSRGGEERAVEDLAWLIRTELGEPAAVLERDSAARFLEKHVHSRWQRRVMPPVHRVVAVWGGRLDRLKELRS